LRELLSEHETKENSMILDPLKINKVPLSTLKSSASASKKDEAHTSIAVGGGPKTRSVQKF